MDIRPYTVAITLVFLVSCDKITEISVMRTSVEERLSNYALEVPEAKAEPIELSKGLAHALGAAVSTNEGYLGSGGRFGKRAPPTDFRQCQYWWYS